MREDVPSEHFTIPLGEASIDAEGDDVTVISYGAMMKECREVATRMAGRGVSVEVVDLRSLVPLDMDTVRASVEKTGRCVVVTEAPRTSGFASEVAASVAESCLYVLESPIERVTGWDTVFPLKRGEHLYLPGVDRIQAAIGRTLAS